MASPFLSLDRRTFPSEVMIRADHVSYVEVARAASGAKIAIGLYGGQVIDSFLFPPDDQALTSLRAIRDTIINDVADKLTPDTPAWREVPAVGDR